MTLSDWQEAMIGHKFAGTVTDAVSGATASYSWTCDSVDEEPGTGRVKFVVGNATRGAYREFGKDVSVLALLTPAALTAEMDALLRADVTAQLAASRFSALAGQEL